MSTSEPPIPSPAAARNRVARRSILAVMAGSVGGISLASTSPAVAATPDPSPKLPGEYYRKANQVTASGGTPYDNITVRINGDPARLFVPQGVKPGAAVRVVWFYHGAGSDHTALDGGFKGHAELVVDEGAVCICQNAGGTLYSHPRAQQNQLDGYAWISGVYSVYANVLRATSGGGALGCETYGSRLIPDIRGLYMVNAVYDIRALYDMGGGNRASVVGAFGDDPAAIDAANPKRHPASAWAGTNLRIVVSQPDSSDRTVPPETNGKALYELALPVAADCQLKPHATGHNTPGFAKTDFITVLRQWAPARAAADTTAPTVQITSPAPGTAVSGTVTLIATATDNVGVTGVTFTVGSGGQVVAATSTTDGWKATVNVSTLADGPLPVTATAKDAAGNSTTSGTTTLVVANPDRTAPTVRITSPTDGSTVKGSVTLVATAADDVGVRGVSFAVSGRSSALTATSGQDGWTAVLDSTTVPDGTHTVTATATDAAGNSTTSAAVSILVGNADTTAPTTAITSPAAGASTSGTITLVASAADDVGVSSVTFVVSGAPQPLAGTSTANGWTAQLDTTALVNGAHTVTSTARDAAGNQTVSPAVSFVVDNADTQAPVVRVTAPAAGSTVSGTVLVTAVATDNVKVTGVTFYANGRLFGTAAESGGVWSYSFNTRTRLSPNGQYALTAKAVDAAGNTTESAPDNITIRN